MQGVARVPRRAGARRGEQGRVTVMKRPARFQAPQGRQVLAFLEQRQSLHFAGCCEGLRPNPEDFVRGYDRNKPVADCAGERAYG